MLSWIHFLKDPCLLDTDTETFMGKTDKRIGFKIMWARGVGRGIVEIR